jgi:hypothetical protein
VAKDFGTVHPLGGESWSCGGRRKGWMCPTTRLNTGLFFGGGHIILSPEGLLPGLPSHVPLQQQPLFFPRRPVRKNLLQRSEAAGRLISKRSLRKNLSPDLQSTWAERLGCGRRPTLISRPPCSTLPEGFCPGSLFARTSSRAYTPLTTTLRAC